MLPTRLEMLLSEAALVRLRASLGERDDAVVALVGSDLVNLWATPVGAAAVYRRGPDDYVGRSTLRFLPSEDRSRFRQAVSRALAGRTVRYDGRASRGDGGWIEVRSVLWPTIDRDAVVIVSVPVAPRPGR